MDPTQSDQLQYEERASATLSDVLSIALRQHQVNVHTALPGLVQSFNPITQTAEIQCTIMRFIESVGYMPIPMLVDCPVFFPSGGGFAFTFPIAQGDECLVIFAERSIDRWFAYGGIQPPGEYRMHDYSDGFALVGVRSQPNKLPTVSTSAVQLLSVGTPVVSIDASGATITGNVHVTGTLTVDGAATAQGTNVHTHMHLPGAYTAPNGAVTGNSGAPI